MWDDLEIKWKCLKNCSIKKKTGKSVQSTLKSIYGKTGIAHKILSCLWV